LKECEVDLDIKKNFGPRVEDNRVVPGTSKILNGRDIHFRDAEIIRIL